MDEEIGFASASYARQKNRKEEGKGKPSSIVRVFAGGERSQYVSFYFLGKAGVRGECQDTVWKGIPADVRLESLLLCLANAPHISCLQRQNQTTRDGV